MEAVSAAMAATVLIGRNTPLCARSAKRKRQCRFLLPQVGQSTALTALRRFEATGLPAGISGVAVAAASSKSHKKDPSGSFLMGTREGRFYYAFVFVLLAYGEPLG